MITINNHNYAKEFMKRSSIFIIFYIVISYFMITMPNVLDSGLLLLANNILILCPFLLIFILVMVGRSMVHICPESIDKYNAAHAFIMSGILFHITIWLFFVVVMLWIIALGGVLHSAFAGLLTTAPVFFIFGYSTHYNILFGCNENTVHKQLYRLSLVELSIKYLTYLVYIISVLSFDYLVICKAVGLKNIPNHPVLKFVAPNADEIIKSNQFQIMSIFIFLGSVVVIVVHYLNIRKKNFA